MSDDQLKSRQRSMPFDKTQTTGDSIRMSVSSNTDQILRYVAGHGVGYEVLNHDSLKNINLSRFTGPKGGPVLLDHEATIKSLVGRATSPVLEGGKLFMDVRIGSSPEGVATRQKIDDDIVTDTSVSYDYDPEDVVVVKNNGRDYPTFNVMRWSLTEVSLVAVPADVGTGVGRSANWGEDDGEASADGTCSECGLDASECECEDGPRQKAAPVDDTEDDDNEDPEDRSKTEAPAPVADRSLSAVTTASRSQAAQSGPTTTEVSMETNTNVAADAANNAAELFQIRSIAENHGKGREAEQILAAKSLPEARAEILKLLATTPIAAPKSVEDLGASRKELEQFSYARLLGASADMAEGKRAKSLETEISDAIAKTMPASYTQRGGVFVPYQLRNARALDSKTTGGAAEMVFEVPGELIEALRNSLKVAALGGTYLTGLSSPVGFAKQTAIAQASWVAENSGTDVAESDLATGIVVLTPRTLQGTSSFSRQLLATASYPVESMVRFDLGYAHAAAVDKAALHGTGVNQPTGIYNLAGVNVEAMGGAPTYAKLVDMIAAVAGQNALLGGAGFVTDPATAAKMLTTLEFAVNGSAKLWDGNIEEGQVAGYKAVSTNQVASNLGTGANEHGLVFGAWSQAVIGGFGGGFEVITDPYRLKKQGIVEVTSFSMHDVVFRHPGSFTKATGIVLS